MGSNGDEDAYYWADGSPRGSYTNWMPGQPSSLATDCGRMLDDGLWIDDSCASASGALCAAPRCGHDVTVSIAKASPGVSPRNVGATVGGLVDWTPPHPTVSVDGEQVARTANELAFLIDYSSDAPGLQAGDISVSAGDLGVTGIELVPLSTSRYRVTVHTETCIPSCPPSYVPKRTSTGSVHCVKVVMALLSWEEASAACAPYSLASITSAEHNAFIDAQAVASAWYAALHCRRHHHSCKPHTKPPMCCVLWLCDCGVLWAVWVLAGSEQGRWAQSRTCSNGQTGRPWVLLRGRLGIPSPPLRTPVHPSPVRRGKMSCAP